jgi:DNA-binding protein HU-beta
MALKSKKKAPIELPATCGPKDLAKVYADKYGCSLKDAEEAIRNTVEVMCDTLAKGHSVSFLGQFAMSVDTRAERQGRNPKTGEAMTIAASKVIKFKAGASLKKAINA